ncbi:multicopper oxidase family protein [Desulfuromonas sp. TF]|uniref:multicopper oxidase family protein n=1 Tax=Desulfuromonas sp. TF TaxID=1232410 RepID=UPI00040A3F97|nr:multicopper oxidase domain-containing protein [Desulfuromonas sp. TF]
MRTLRTGIAGGIALVLLCGAGVSAEPLPGGTLDPTEIPKYVTPLVIPPVMKNDGSPDSYDIAVREFKQQILPGGIWNSINGRDDKFKATTVWSYGPADDPLPEVAPNPDSGFNYPAYTIESVSGTQVDVRWINGLVDKNGRYLEHLLPVDQTVHWANPPQECRDGTERTDCAGISDKVYKGPVPIVTHLHGAHVEPHSDGYPEAWWLPAANNIPEGYATEGRLFDDSTGQSPGNSGYADYSYLNDQPATTLWYHDHTLGMTRLNVYAGPAGFWLIRGGAYDQPEIYDSGEAAVLPGPAPVAGQGVLDLNVPGGARDGIREIPVAIQDRSFDRNGRLFYPKYRAFFEGITRGHGRLQIDFASFSDVLPHWQPEAFFNVMVVNGVSWPQLEVGQARYRFRLLNGCDSRFLNLALFVVTGPGPDGETGTGDDILGEEIPFYQIGAEQGFLTNVVEVRTGFATLLPGDGTIPAGVPAPDPDQALLMGPAERADVIVDFSGLGDGTVVRMINTGPDEPFGGFSLDATPGDEPEADAGTTGQVMQFVVDAELTGWGGTDPGTETPATAPQDLVLNAEGPLGALTRATPRNVSLNEAESEEVCVLLDVAEDAFVVPIRQVPCDMPDPEPGVIEVVPFGPTEALLGQVSGSGTGATGIPLKWTDTGGPDVAMKLVELENGNNVTVHVTENPAEGAVEEWDIYNFTADAHPIHLHLVRFEVVARTLLDGTPSPNGSRQPWETGFKDTVVAYPGEITTVKARFDIPGLYVWHCHIVEHEDNEMMRPYAVGLPTLAPE